MRRHPVTVLTHVKRQKEKLPIYGMRSLGRTKRHAASKVRTFVGAAAIQLIREPSH